MTDPYSVLGVACDASDEEITRAYRALARKYHPDLHPGDKRAESNMKNLNAAYMQIQDVRSGKSYRSAEGWGGSEPDSGRTGRSGYGYGTGGQNPFGDFYYGTGGQNPYGGFYGGNGNPFGGEYGGRRVYRRRAAPASFGLFGFPFVRVIFVIIVLRFVIGVVFSLLAALGGQGYYYPQAQSAYTTAQSTAQSENISETETGYTL